MRPSRRRLLSALIVAPLLLLGACAMPNRSAAVPTEIQDRAVVLNNPALRTWDDTLNEKFREEIFRAGGREMELRKEAGDNSPLPPAYYLAISGGGANGAYGAGMLNGWTDAGTRPEFKVVTGISTGALTAPFAYLGSAYDADLRKVYTSVTTKQIAKSRGFMAALFDDALMDTVPLRHLMEQLVNEQMMKDIAKEYAKGRILMVATTDLDADRGVIWNVGAIATIGGPDALKLIHDILIASAAIPAAFPPVMIDVEVDGKKYQEMHVDGGAKAQVFLYPPSVQLKSDAAARGINRERRAYIVRNARLDPGWASVERRTLSIAGRAISSLIQTQGIGDLYRLYTVCKRDGVDFNLAYIPSSFNETPKEDFDPVYMSKLFDVGYNAAKAGYKWEKMPPGFKDGSTDTPAAAAAPAALK